MFILKRLFKFKSKETQKPYQVKLNPQEDVMSEEGYNDEITKYLQSFGNSNDGNFISVPVVSVPLTPRNNSPGSSDFDPENNNATNSDINKINDVNVTSVLGFLLDKNNPTINKAFIEFCTKSACVENVNFLYAYRELKQLKHYSEIYRKSCEIYREYVATTAPSQLNLDAVTVTNIRELLGVDSNEYTGTYPRIYSKHMRDRLKQMYNGVYHHITNLLASNTVIPFIHHHHITSLSDAISESSRSKSSRSSKKSISNRTDDKASIRTVFDYDFDHE
ncbi:hypothetical protein YASMINEVIRUS_361 [Yasminevirus sp. GU-2018]|uniref:RGS domain-containing protein n=1 Tax=Yasminevirus sp. GU-2018 TaxID=2420051 RepID=A0A5K0U7H5_9VIRU|nr:hypothetical protein YASMINEVIRUS_361 [Yasminevirus sp. GU-2018]